MSDKVLEFPERRQSIPVNLPDIGCAETARCPDCNGSVWTVMVYPGSSIPCHYRCVCGHIVDLCIEIEA